MYEVHSMKLTEVKLADLESDPKNARLHNEKNITEIKRSLEEFGQHRPFVVRRNSNVVIIGNGMLESMLELGWEKAYAYFVNDDDEQAVRRALADNRTAELAEWDEDVLQELLADNASIPSLINVAGLLPSCE